MDSYSGPQNPAVATLPMSKLNAFGRPHVEFDVRNKEHRKLMGRFLQTNSWGHCPYRFYVTGHVNPILAMREQLMQYYVAKEFGKINS
jgi:hypothetical protein